MIRVLFVCLGNICRSPTAEGVFRALVAREGLAHAVATAMKDWAMEHGATHFTHWFLPMTGATAEKHDAFISWDEPGQVVERFSGSMLIQGEPDASSFPSGGLRATFEARGYTAWDPTSPAFLMEGPLGITLCIPTAFIGYHGEALDQKVPLMRSMDVVSKAAVTALSLPGTKATSVVAMRPGTGIFLVDADLKAAPRLQLQPHPARCAPAQARNSRTTISVPSRRGCWASCRNRTGVLQLGIPAKTRHNEVAPNQSDRAHLRS